MGLGHCGDSYLDLPPPLSRQTGREADIINPSLLTHLFHFITPSSSQLEKKPRWRDILMNSQMCTVTSLIYYEEV